MCWGGLGQDMETELGRSSSLAIKCIFLCLALVLPLVSLCLAAMHLTKAILIIEDGHFSIFTEKIHLVLIWT